jgi:thymidylate synthase (FAD)
MSGRYTELPNLYYIPGRARLRAGGQSATNKQSSGTTIDESVVDIAEALMEAATKNSREVYEQLLMMGVSKELARLVLPINQYSRMRASANLRNWLGFLTLRLDQSAQWEIRQYAQAVWEILGTKFPRTMLLFDEGAT